MQKRNISNITHPGFYYLWIQALPTYMIKKLRKSYCKQLGDKGDNALWRAEKLTLHGSIEYAGVICETSNINFSENNGLLFVTLTLKSEIEQT